MTSTMLHASLLPTIKCSSCGSEIEISMMGDHICDPGAQEEEETSPQTSRTDHDRIDTRPSTILEAKVYTKSQRSTLEPDGPLLPRTSFVRPSKPKPAPINAEAANNLDESPSTNNELPGPQSALPSLASRESESLSFKVPPKSATGVPADVQNEMNKSIEHGEKSRTSNTHLWPLQNNNQSFAPVSPKVVSGGSLLQRMNSIAPGPFNAKARKMHNKKLSVDAMGKSGSPTISGSSSPMDDLPRGPPPPRPARPNRPEQLLDYLPEDRQAINGSPKTNMTVASSVRQDHHARGRSSIYTTIGHVDEDLKFTDPTYEGDKDNFSRSSPAVSPTASRDGQPGQGMLTNNLAKHNQTSSNRDMATADHTPTLSVSSNESRNTYDDRPPSSRSSPPTSNGSMLSHGQHSFDQLSSIVDSDPPSAVSTPYRPTEEEQSFNERPNNRSSLVSKFNREKSPDRNPLDSVKPSRKPSPARDPNLESKIQRADSHFRKAKTPVVGGDNDSSDQGGQKVQGNNTLRPARSTRKTSSSKGNCRGCGTEIIGKSIRAADGRLTGRYHRECFRCKTCNEQFPTADFYVLDDHPYCAHHYHVLNRSLCHSCNQGIEGSYLETQPGVIYHAQCFKCHECRKPLSRDYFEINDHAYCEGDAMRAYKKTQLLAPGRRFPERRTTRQMMM